MSWVNDDCYIHYYIQQQNSNFASNDPFNTKDSPQQSYNDNGTGEQYCWNHFQQDFSSWWTIKNKNCQLTLKSWSCGRWYSYCHRCLYSSWWSFNQIHNNFTSLLCSFPRRSSSRITFHRRAVLTWRRTWRRSTGSGSLWPLRTTSSHTSPCRARRPSSCVCCGRCCWRRTTSTRSASGAPLRFSPPVSVHLTRFVIFKVWFIHPDPVLFRMSWTSS